MSIVTKTGDKGETSLFGGERVPKHDLRVAAYGEVDELNSALGVLLAEDLATDIRAELVAVQSACFTVGGELATPPTALQNLQNYIPRLGAVDLDLIEGKIKEREAIVPPQQKFILPNGTRAAALSFWARAVARRAERSVAALAAESAVSPVILQYLNRLSDYFFILGRALNHQAGVKEDEWAGGRR